MASLTDLPGVYRMLDESGNVLYVGKAKNLKKRVSSYFRKEVSSPRIALMVRQIASIETTVTRSEAEALLLENNLIKTLSPRYNIIFRDDKSYPYIVLSKDEYPKLGFYRGATSRHLQFFGPFPSSAAVRESIVLLQRMFRLRTCENSVFNHRSRPCLLYQIKRCSAPCVGAVTHEDYRGDVRLAALFLQGKHQDVIQRLQEHMEAAASQLEFEKAALYRDQVQSLRMVQERQFIESHADENLDIVGVVQEGNLTCVNLAMVRGGRHLGDRPLFPSHCVDQAPLEILQAFLVQHYLSHPVPEKTLIALPLDDHQLNELKTLVQQIEGAGVSIVRPKFQKHKIWVEMVEQNALLAIRAKKAQSLRQNDRAFALLQRLEVDTKVENLRIECFDISHTQGELPVASCVVYQGDGMKKSDYRRFNIRDVTPGDDYAAIRQAVMRRYEKTVAGEMVCPDVILIDGGKGQLRMAAEALEEVGLDLALLVGVAKGEERKPGLETLFFVDEREPVHLEPTDPALHLIQEVRDEAHRFAVSGHRQRRSKPRKTSRLEDIPGVGPKRRKALISHFGGMQGILNAGIDQLSAVPGISREMAETIYGALR